jgi:hypothetical protein
VVRVILAIAHFLVIVMQTSTVVLTAEAESLGLISEGAGAGASLLEVIANPFLLGGLAVGGLAMGVYHGYRWLNRPKTVPVEAQTLTAPVIHPEFKVEVIHDDPKEKLFTQAEVDQIIAALATDLGDPWADDLVLAPVDWDQLELECATR